MRKNKAIFKRIVRNITRDDDKNLISIDKQEPVIWTNKDNQLIQFYNVAKLLELNHIIYVIDAIGELKSVWATNENDIVDCINEFSNNFLFGRIHKIEDAIKYRFFDEYKNKLKN
jgi:hypothetical protein